MKVNYASSKPAFVTMIPLSVGGSRALETGEAVMEIPHPIPYQGSKRALANTITGLFPQGADRLVEPFVGSAAVSLAAAYQGKVDRFLLCDANEGLIRLWREILDRPKDIADAYERLWWRQQERERKFYDAVRARFNQTQRPEYFLYLLARCVKASVRYNPDGQFNQSPDNRRKGAKPTTMRARIFGASGLLRSKTELGCMDYNDALRRTTPSDIVYMDPPYAGICRGKDKRYAGTVSFEEQKFVESLHTLNERGISFILSYDGRTGEKTFGDALPDSLGLTHLEVNVGRSSQATLLGRDDTTVESLYLSPALVTRTRDVQTTLRTTSSRQIPLFNSSG